MALAAVSLGFVSCGDDDDDVVINHDKTAAEASVGEYAGTWSAYASQADRENGVNATATSEGSATFTTTDEKYVGSLTLKTESTVAPFGIDATDKINIAWTNNTIKFTNPIATNAFGCAIASEIIDGNVVIRLVKSVKEGRKSTVYYYEFIGTKK